MAPLLTWVRVHRTHFGYFIGGLLLGTLASFVLMRQPASPTLSGLRLSDISYQHQTYRFIDPLIALKGVTDSPKYAPMQEEIERYIQNAKETTPLVTASLEFRDINVPGGFVVGRDERYTPASLNKVPLMMTYFKLAEQDPNILSELIRNVGTMDHNEVQDIRSPVTLEMDQVYSVEQLIEHMIRYSDNNASGLLTAYLKTTHRFNAFTSLMSDLGIDPSTVDTYSDTITVQEYSRFLRALYNATYLSRDYSERALQLLTETDFTRGLEAGIPNSIQIAEKFGEVRMVNTTGTQVGKQLNNCGIVYYPLHPYLLCIMTKASGSNTAELETFIAGISQIVYRSMQHLYP